MTCSDNFPILCVLDCAGLDFFYYSPSHLFEPTFPILGTCQNPLSPKPHIFFYLFMTRASASGNNHDQTWEPLTPTAVIKMSNHIMRRRKHIS